METSSYSGSQEWTEISNDKERQVRKGKDHLISSFRSWRKSQKIKKEKKSLETY